MAKKKKYSFLEQMGMSEQAKADVENTGNLAVNKAVKDTIKKTATSIAKSEQKKADTEQKMYQENKKSANKLNKAIAKKTKSQSLLTTNQQIEHMTVSGMPMEAQKNYYAQNQKTAKAVSKEIENTIKTKPFASGFVQGFSNAMSFGTSGDIAENTSEATGRKVNSYNNSTERYEQKKAQIESDKQSGAISEEEYQKRMAKADSQYENESKGRKLYEGGKIVGEMTGYIPVGGVGSAVGKGIATKVAINTVKKELAKGGSKLTGKALTNSAKEFIATHGAKALSGKQRFAYNRIGDAIGGQVINVPMALQDSKDANGNIDAKEFAKNVALNTALDVGTGGLLEGASKGIKAIANNTTKGVNTPNAKTPTAETKQTVETRYDEVPDNSNELLANWDNLTPTKRQNANTPTKETISTVSTQETSRRPEDMVMTSKAKKTTSQKIQSLKDVVKGAKREFVNSLDPLETEARKEARKLKKDANDWYATRKKSLKSKLDKGEITQKQYLTALSSAKAEKGAKLVKADTKLATVNSIRQASGVAETNIYRFQTDYNGHKTGDSLVNIETEVLNGAKSKAEKEQRYKDFQLLMYHKHNIDRAAHDTPIFKKPDDPNFDKDTEIELSKREIARILKQYPEFETTSNKLRNYLDNMQNKRVKSGIISKEKKSELDKVFGNYVPTFRNVDNGTIIDGFHAKGSDIDILPLFHQVAEQERKLEREISLNDLLKETNGEVIPNTQKKDVLEVDPRDETTRTYIIKDNHGKPTGEVQYYENGNIISKQIPKEFAEAIELELKNGKTGHKGWDTINSFLGEYLTTPFKGLVTSFSPAFAVRNFIRDYPEAIINSKDAKEFLKTMRIKGEVWNSYSKGNKWGELFDASGASAANFTSLDDVFRKGTSKNIAQKIEAINSVVESFSRRAEFIATLKRLGYTEDTLKYVTKKDLQTAALNAADITVNFGRSGRTGKFLNRGLVPFLNASIQGGSKYIRNIPENPVKGAMGVAMKAVALGVPVSILNEVLYKDDEDYQKLNDYAKYNNLIIKTGEHEFIKIPYSRLCAVLGIIPKNIASDKLGSENEDNVTQILRVIGNNVAPVNLLESNIFSPLIQTKNNKTWYGTPIDTEEYYGDKNKSEHYDDSTSLLAVGISKLLNKINPKLEVSPRKFDYLADQFGGVAYDLIKGLMTPETYKKVSKEAVDELVKGGMSEEQAKALLGVETAVKASVGAYAKSQFTLDSDKQNTIASNYYADREQTEILAEDGDEEAKARLEIYKTYDSRIKKANEVIKAIKSSDNYGDKLELAQMQRQSILEQASTGEASKGSGADYTAYADILGTSQAMEIVGSKEDNALYKKASKKGVTDEEWNKTYADIRNLRDNGVTGTLTSALVVAESNNDNLAKAYDIYDKKTGESASKYARAKEYLKNGTMESYSKFQTKIIKKKATNNKSLTAMVLAKNNATDNEYMLYDIDENKQALGQALADSNYSAKKLAKLKAKADTDNNGNTTKKEAVAYLETQDLTTEQKATLFALMLPNANNPYGTTYGAINNTTSYQGTGSASGTSGSTSSKRSASDIEPITYGKLDVSTPQRTSMTNSQLKSLIKYLNKVKY